MNKCIFSGTVCKKGEITHRNADFIKFSLCVKRKFKQGEDTVDFVNLTAFGKTAEYISKWVEDKNKVVVETRYQTGSYEKDGKKTYTHDFLVESIEKTDWEQKIEADGFTREEDDSLPFN